MAVPKCKKSVSRTGMKRSHHALKPANVVIDQTTGEKKLYHKMTKNGFYKGKKVLITKSEYMMQQDIKSGS